MTIYLLESSVLSDEQLTKMNAVLPSERRQRAEKITKSVIRRESITVAYLTLYGLAVGKTDSGLVRPDADRLLSRVSDVQRLSVSTGWPVDERGKPFAGGVPNQNGNLYVSLSHSEGLTAVAVSDKPVGADIQRIPDSSKMLMRIAAKFHPKETEWLSQLPESRLPLEFCRLWACKESVMKLCGKGLSLPLSSFYIDETLTSELNGRRIQLQTEVLSDAVFAAAFWMKTE